ncbi:potassium voltage-gated channel subfamily C member 3-like [Lineus longissimus]|uniref:potassium voltage-gated channel subfamily C member 3-like n=1 Tax=Lineus longissimus TaxID=88925 RepID=UPI00315C8CBC
MHLIEDYDTTRNGDYVSKKRRRLSGGVLRREREQRATQKVHLDIGGIVFTTFPSTLSIIPGSLLSSLSCDCEFYNKCTNTYYFDRNPEIFPSILDCYRTGEFHIPLSCCIGSINNELKFWKIPEEYIATCCLKRIEEFEVNRRTMEDLKREFKSSLEEHLMMLGNLSRCADIKLRCWMFLEFPAYSKHAKWWSFFVGMLLVISVINLALSSHPVLTVQGPHNISWVGEFKNNPKFARLFGRLPHPVIVRLDEVVNIILTFEIVTRLITCPSKKNFFRSVLNWLDMTALLTYWVFSIMMNISIYTDLDTREFVLIMFILGSFIFLRILRLFKISSTFKSLRILILVLKRNSRELSTLVLFLMLGMLLFSSLVYLAELHVPDTFTNIPDAFWWSVITMTTVGYGDMYPKSYPGYLVGVMCAMAGMVVSGLAIPIISNNFSLYYNYAKYFRQKFKVSANKNAVSENRFANHGVRGMVRRFHSRKTSSRELSSDPDAGDALFNCRNVTETVTVI